MMDRISFSHSQFRACSVQIHNMFIAYKLIVCSVLELPEFPHNRVIKAHREITLEKKLKENRMMKIASSNLHVCVCVCDLVSSLCYTRRSFTNAKRIYYGTFTRVSPFTPSLASAAHKNVQVVSRSKGYRCFH